MGGTFTVNGGDINFTSHKENGSNPPMSAPYTQNGGNVNITAKSDFITQHDITLNGGSLNVASENKRISSGNITIAPGAYFKATSGVGMISSFRNFYVAEGAPENSYFFAKTSEDGEFVLVRDASTLKDAKYLELKVDTHEHSFSGNDACICGIKKADYSKYNDTLNRFIAILDEYEDEFNDAAKAYIDAEVQKIADEYPEASNFRSNYTEEEQYILDGFEEMLDKICDTLEEGIADGTFIKPDCAEIEAKIAEFEKNHPGEEYAELIAGMKADLEEIKAAESHADITDDVAAIEEKMEKAESCEHMCHQGGFTGFIWRIICFFLKLFGSNPVCECGAVHY